MHPIDNLYKLFDENQKRAKKSYKPKKPKKDKRTARSSSLYNYGTIAQLVEQSVDNA